QLEDLVPALLVEPVLQGIARAVAAGAVLAHLRLHAESSGVSPGSAARNSSPGNCRTQSSWFVIGVTTKSLRRVLVRSTLPLPVWKVTACAHTRYLPSGSGGK